MPEPQHHHHPHRLSVSQFVAAEADRVLTELVPLAGLVDAAVKGDNIPLARARTSDCHEVFATLCPCQLRALLVVAAVELSRLEWAPDDHPDAAEVDPEAELPAAPPEVAWGVEQ